MIFNQVLQLGFFSSVNIIAHTISDKDSLVNLEVRLREFKNVECIYTITIPNEESSITAKQLKELIKEEHTNVKASDSLENALVEIGEKYPDSRACIIGSLYLCGYVLRVN